MKTRIVFPNKACGGLAKAIKVEVLGPVLCNLTWMHYYFEGSNLLVQKASIESKFAVIPYFIKTSTVYLFRVK